MGEGVRLVLKSAVLSRVIVFILQAIFNLLPDHQADAFNPPSQDNIGVFDKVIHASLDGYNKWDAKYFLSIAETGYTEEQMYAFFPLFPMMMKLLAAILSNLPVALTFQTCLLLSGAVINFLFFVGAVRALYYLTLRIYGSERFATLTALMFSFNPASIFFSANYTESLYAFCVFEALLYIRDGSLFKSTFFFVCASATRSNGLVNMGFPGYFMIETLVNLYRHEKKILPYLIPCILKTFVIVLMIVMPFCAFNWMGYTKFCTNQKGFFNSTRPWCGNFPPLVYQYLQSEHWGLGFLKYYRIRKIPNIILATPCVLLTFYGIIHYTRIILPFTLRNPPGHLRHRLQFLSKDIFVYFVHALILALFGIFYMHVEVITRFIFSSSPFPSWVSASILMRDLSNTNISSLFNAPSTMAWKKLQICSKLLITYYAMYVIIGILLHVNFLPWT